MPLIQISKETEDKVKLAKKYIEGKYESMIMQQKQQHQNWKKIQKMLENNCLSKEQKSIFSKQYNEKQQQKKRLLRQKDSLKNYELLSIIGKGAFGDVRIARNKQTNQIVAIKRMKKSHLADKRQLSAAYIERQFLIKCSESYSNNFLLSLFSTFQDSLNLYLVMQYVPGGDLLQLLIKKDIFTEEQTRFYIAQLIVGVQEIHNNKFIHRDIKPDNILIDKKGHIKISDFGLSKYLGNQHLKTQLNKGNKKKLQRLSSTDTKKKVTKKIIPEKLAQIPTLSKLSQAHERSQRKFSKVGTPDYISPEVLLADSYDFSADIWSIGVIMFECLFGYPPFSDEDSIRVCKKVINWKDYLEFPDDHNVSLDAKMLILGMMNDQSKRLTFKQIKQHKFFTDVNWDYIKQRKYIPPMIPNLLSDIDIQYFNRQFEQNEEWEIQEPQKAVDDLANDEIQYKSLNNKFNFPGFQYKRYDSQPFKEVEHDIKECIRNNSKNKPSILENMKVTKQPSLKRLCTQQQDLTTTCSSQFSIKKRSKNKIYAIKRPGNSILKTSANCNSTFLNHSKSYFLNNTTNMINSIEKEGISLKKKVKKVGSPSKLAFLKQFKGPQKRGIKTQHA